MTVSDSITFEQPLYSKAVGIVLSSPQLEGVIARFSFYDDQHGFNKLHDVRCVIIKKTQNTIFLNI